MKLVLDGKREAKDVAGVLQGILSPTKSNIIPILRNSFNPTEFFREGGWSIVVDATDTRSIALTELDLNKIELVSMLNEGEKSIKSEEKFARLRAPGKIRLDADVFMTLFKNKTLIPNSWKTGKYKTPFVAFDGTILRDPGDGLDYVLCLYWGDGTWFWETYCLDRGWSDHDLSAVLVS